MSYYQRIEELEFKVQDIYKSLNLISKQPCEVDDAKFADQQSRIDQIIKLFVQGDCKLETEIDILFSDFKKLREEVDAITKQKFSEFHHIKPDIEKLEKLEKRIEEMCAQSLKKVPHKCPVCDGCCRVLTEAAKHDFDGMLRAGLETSINCKACKGTGIVWG